MLLHIFALTLSLSFLTCFADRVPWANFVFGDSLVDAGNNNYLVTLSKANYAPNGIDFGRPTGRYTNGRTIVDIIGQELGLEDFAPPFLDPATTGDLVLRGVNYASGGGGILNHTGYIFGGRINLDAQLDNFANTRNDIVSRVGPSSAREVIENSLFTVTMGSNDFINNYLLPFLSKPEQALIPPQDFVEILTARYTRQLTRLFELGARKIVVVNMGPIGCIPYIRDANPSAGEGCVTFPNQLAELFNSKLKLLVHQLTMDLHGSDFVYANVHSIFEDILQNYVSYGFENANSACCYVAGRFGGQIPCTPASRICSNRRKNVFWDPYHPSEAANMIVAKRLLDGDSQDISPKNIRQLMKDRRKNVFWDPYHLSKVANMIVAKRSLVGDSQDISPKNIRQLMKVHSYLVA